uniref:MAP7 domain-containing protein 3-like n=1 Tax=Phascolarctos cinereus TaxID=38626 RepID=A0A6P5ITG6_PHACI|nr:MAP7 domain-containing protein 3-like [Phascolarctos cinereus]
MPMRSRSIDRPKSPMVAVSTSAMGSIQKAEVDKYASTHAARRAPSPSVSGHKRSPSPADVKHPPSPSASKPSQRSRPPSPISSKQQPSSPTCVLKPALKLVQRPLITPTVSNITKKGGIPATDSKLKDICEEKRKHEGQTSPASEKEKVASAGKTKEEPSSQTGAGTTSGEEAAKILTEKRELTQELRDREEWERCQKGEERRRKLRPKPQEEAERQRRERERIMEQSIQERLERKKRIEEIMRRTRKVELNSEQSEEKSKNEAIDGDAADEVDGGNLETVDPLANVTEIDSPENVKTPEGLSAETIPTLAYTEQAKAAAQDETEGLVTNADEMAREPENRGCLPVTLATDSRSPENVKTPEGLSAETFPTLAYTEQAKAAAQDETEGLITNGDEMAREPENRDCLPMTLATDSRSPENVKTPEGLSAETFPTLAYTEQAKAAAQDETEGLVTNADEMAREPENRDCLPVTLATDSRSPENVKTPEGLSAETFPTLAYTEQAKAAAEDETEGLVTNGDEMAREPENRDCLPMTLATHSGLSAKDMITPNSEIMDTDEAEHTSNLNGKSSTWTFEDLIEVGVHAKSNVSNAPSESCTQNSSKAVTFAPGPELAFEEDTVMNSLATSEGSNSDL